MAYYDEDYDTACDKLPCKTCIVVSTCTRSFIDETACEEYWEKVRERFRERRRKNEDQN